MKDSASGEKNSERVYDIVELKRFRIRVISIRRRLRNAGELDPQASPSCTEIFIFSA